MEWQKRLDERFRAQIAKEYGVSWARVTQIMNILKATLLAELFPLAP